MRNLVFLLVLFLALSSCKGGEKTAKNNMKKREVELILQTRESADISAVCLARGVYMVSVQGVNRTYTKWLVHY